MGGCHHGLSLTVKDPRLSQKVRLSWTIMDYHGLMDYHRLLQTIMDYHGGGHHGLSLTSRILEHPRGQDYHGLSWSIMDYHGLSWTIMDYHVSFFANIDSISTTLSSISTTLIFNLMTVYPQLFQYIHNLAQYIHNFNSVYPQPRSLLLSRCRD